ncbi:MAG: hypothetical protein IPM61_11725 [Chlorobi bacterium]|nr:MAG: hypothetical protein UZ07_CHB004002832 [Chlorobi bacterium OLB7]MBK8911982.1 hypothetical protein [Chlorobiota bacterium]MBX7215379.1 hypothetical protein [Candidatus Kapabacteria bacterium]
MLRKVPHIIMLLAFVIQTEGSLLTWITYAVNSDIIAALYCQNPTDPCCHGKCHTTKVAMQEEEGKEPGVRIILPEQLPCLAMKSVLIPTPSIITLLPFPESSASPLCQGLPQAIDHPPPIC